MSQAVKIQEEMIMDHTPVAAVAAGDVVVQGSLVGIATAPIAAGTLGALETEGVFDIVKPTGSITAGAPLYWKTTGSPVGGVALSGAVSTTSSDGQFIGYAVAAAGSSDTTVRVRVFGVSTTNYTPQSAPITDPGNAGAIPVTGSGYVPLVSAGAETRTLAAPSYAGQVLQLAMKTDGGDIVLTCATFVNQAGNNTITFNDAGDVVTLEAIYVSTNLRWRILRNDGAALSTV